MEDFIFFAASLQVLWYTYKILPTDYDCLARDIEIYNKNGEAILRLNTWFFNISYHCFIEQLKKQSEWNLKALGACLQSI